MSDEIRELEEICMHADFTTPIAGKLYCGVGLVRSVMCKYQSREVDCNNMYGCEHPLHNLDPTGDYQ